MSNYELSCGTLQKTGGTIRPTLHPILVAIDYHLHGYGDFVHWLFLSKQLGSYVTRRRQPLSFKASHSLQSNTNITKWGVMHQDVFPRQQFVARQVAIASLLAAGTSSLLRHTYRMLHRRRSGKMPNHSVG